MIYGSVYGNGSVLTNEGGTIFDESLNFMEIGAAVLEQADSDWNSMMKTIAFTELSYVVENHQEYIYESVDVKAIANKVLDWLKARWEDIKGICQTALAKIQSFISDDEKFVDKYEDQIKAGYGKIKSGFSFKGYIFPDLGRCKDNVKNALEHARTTASGIINGEDIIALDDKEKVPSSNKSTQGKFSQKIDAYRANLVNGAASPGGRSKYSAKDFSKALFEAFHGSAAKKNINSSNMPSVDTIIEAIKTGKEDIENAKDARDTNKDTIDSFIDNVESWRDKVSDDDKSTERTKAMTYFKDLSSYLKECSKANITWYSCYVTAIKDRNRQNKALAVKLVSFAGYMKHESYTAQGYGMTSMFEAAFANMDN